MKVSAELATAFVVAKAGYDGHKRNINEILVELLGVIRKDAPDTTLDDVRALLEIWELK